MSLKSFYAPLQAQESTLLDIPSEIRNSIYDALCEISTEVTVCYRGRRHVKPIDHPLARTCRQTREEFHGIWESSGAHNATTVVYAIKNFDFGDLSKMREWLAALPPLRDDKARTYIMRSFIDNNFEKSVRQRQRQSQRQQSFEEPRVIRFQLEVSFDYATLDIGNIRAIMSLCDIPRVLDKAFEQAVHRHKSKQAELRRTRAEKRSIAFEAAVEEEA